MNKLIALIVVILVVYAVIVNVFAESILPKCAGLIC